MTDNVHDHSMTIKRSADEAYLIAERDGFALLDIAIDEDYANLGMLGDVSEPFLATALNEIVPGFRNAPRPSNNDLKEISESKANSPLYQIMLAEH